MYNSNLIQNKENIILEEDFLPSIIFYRKDAVIETSKEKLENIITKLYNSFMTRKMAIKELYPDLADEEIDLLLEEIESERLQERDNNINSNTDGIPTNNA